MRRTIAAIALVLLSLGSLASAQPAGRESPSPVTAPPDSFFQVVRERDRDPARQFYKKHIDRYDDESIGVHEFCHTIDGTLRSIDATWNERKRKVYQSAMDRGLWKDSYAATNPGEFWAEICQSYFDCNRVNNWNHGPIGTREQLKVYDPDSFEMVRTAFSLKPEQDWRYRP